MESTMNRPSAALTCNNKLRGIAPRALWLMLSVWIALGATGCRNDCETEWPADGSTTVTDRDLRRVASNQRKSLDEITCADMCRVLRPGQTPNTLYTVVDCEYVAFDDDEEDGTEDDQGDEDPAVGSLTCISTTRNYCSQLGD